MVYIPFVSLLGLQGALNPFTSKPEAAGVLELASVGAPFVNPTLGGGSLLDHDSGGKGEPLNVIYFVTPRIDRPPLIMNLLGV
jgi:hypothetical protein